MNVLYPYRILRRSDDRCTIQFVDIAEADSVVGPDDDPADCARRSLTLALERRLNNDDPIPAPSPADGLPTAVPSTAVQAAMLIRHAREQQGQTLSDLARAMETSWTGAQRLEKPDRNPTLKQLERAATALGRRLVLTME